MSFTCINVSEAKILFEQGAQFVDVRDVGSFQSSHVRGATRVDNSNLQDFMAQAEKGKPLVVYCYGGNSSKGVAEFFAAQGYAEVYSVDGGFSHWQMFHPELCQNN